MHDAPSRGGREPGAKRRGGEEMKDEQMTNGEYTAAVTAAIQGARRDRSGWPMATCGTGVALRAALRLSCSTGLPIGVAAYVGDIAAPGDGARPIAIDDWLRGTAGDARRMLGDATAAAALAIEGAACELGAGALSADVVACASEIAAELAAPAAGRDVAFALTRLFGDGALGNSENAVARLARALLHAPRARRAEATGVMRRARRDGDDWVLPDVAALALWAARGSRSGVPSAFAPALPDERRTSSGDGWLSVVPEGRPVDWWSEADSSADQWDGYAEWARLLRWADQVRDGADGLLTLLAIEPGQWAAEYEFVNVRCGPGGRDAAPGELWVLAEFAMSYLPLTPDEFVRAARDEFGVSEPAARCLRKVVRLTGGERRLTPAEMGGAAYAAWLADGDGDRLDDVLARAQALVIEVARGEGPLRGGRDVEWMARATPIGGADAAAA